MILAEAIRNDEDALICDFAEYYHLYDWRLVPVKQAAILCAGLREDSRTKMRLAGLNVNQDTLLKAAILDQVSIMVWMQTADGTKGRNRPKSVLQVLTSPVQKKDEIRVFASGKDFEKEWKRLTGGE